MKYQLKRLKEWIKKNRNAAVYFAIFISYTLIMLAVYIWGSAGQDGCSSGSLSSIMEEANTTNGNEE